MELPIIAQRRSYKVELEPGIEYLWCSCGKSSTQPFCDDSHIGTSFQPKAFTVEEKKLYSICGCKHSKKEHLCDASHRDLPE